MAEPRLYVKQLELGPMQNFVYLIGDPTTHEAAVIHPGWEVPKILEVVSHDGYRLTKAFVTHHHFDHVGGLKDLLAVIDLPVYVHRADAPMLQIEQGSLKPTSDGDTVSIGQVSVTLLHTPGHTPGSQCLLIDGHLLSGDTLFIRACGRWDLPGGDPAALYHSLVKLKSLNQTTILYPGHNYAEQPTSTIAQEQRTNPFLKPATVEEFLQLVGRG